MGCHMVSLISLKDLCGYVMVKLDAFEKHVLHIIEGKLLLETCRLANECIYVLLHTTLRDI